MSTAMGTEQNAPGIAGSIGAAPRRPEAEIAAPGGDVKARSIDGRGGPLPLVLEPAAAPLDAEQLSTFLDAHRPWVEDQLLAHGALLLRGFRVPDPRAFERVIRAVSPDLKNDYLGTSPRDALTSHVFSASELPPFYPIPQHCEMSFLPAPPSRLFFCCLTAPEGPGGETPLVDFRRVLRDLDPAVRDRFVQKGVRIIRNYAGPEGGSRFDLWKLKRWDEMFQTTDRKVVEARCRESGFEFTWRPGGLLRLVHEQPATRPHPVTGEPVWFNHAQVFHLSSAPAEYRRIVRRLDYIELKLLQKFSAAMVSVKGRLVRPEDQAMHCTYGGGEPIPDSDMEAVRDAIWRNMVFFPWRAGDIVMIDNAAVAHGRMPYRGPRKVVVAWS